jgi:hypothetical protein
MGDNMISRRSKSVLFFIFLFAFTGCKYSDKFKPFKAQNNTFSIEYPPYLKRTQILHPSAPIQGRNGYRDAYFIVDTLKKTDTIGFNRIFDSLKNDLEKSVKEPLLEIQKDTIINGLLFRTAEVTGTLKDKRVLFYLNLAKGKRYNYHIAAWHFKSKKEIWGEDMQKLIFSLKEM